VTKYFEIINASLPHIYHSALVVAPKESIVWKLYESHALPLIRVVCGVPLSWGTNIVAATRSSQIEQAVWSPCNRFIAITWECARVVDVLDSTTLQCLQAFEPPKEISTGIRALAFSPDGYILTHSGVEFEGGKLHIVSWDLQTGGIVSIIRHKYESDLYGTKGDLTYSENGKMVGFSLNHNITIFNVTSGIHIHSHSLSAEILNIWAQGESLWFATIDETTIAIWEVGFTSDAVPTKVMALPIPGGGGDWFQYELVHPLFNLSKLIIDNLEAVQIWDVFNSKLLLEASAGDLGYPSFSPDGCFFASSTKSGVTLWKESPTGYILHKKLTNTTPSSVHISQDGKSVVGVTGHMIQLWHTEDFTTSPLTQAPQHTGNFLLDFSPDGMVAVVAMQKENTAIVLDLKSGVLQLTIDAGMEVLGLSVVGNKVFVLGKQKAVAWNLPTSDCVSNAQVTLKDSSQEMDFSIGEYQYIRSASISPNSHYVAYITAHFSLAIYSVSTGKIIFQTPTDGMILRFSPDSRDVWCAQDNGKAKMWRITDNLHKSGPFTIGIDYLPEGCPWESSCGYQITDDWWVLGPDGKRLLMLPPPWQSFATQWAWRGKFLAFVHSGLSEAVILDLNP